MEFQLDTNNFESRLICDEAGSKDEATQSNDVCDM
jgi:hypothetical protein